MSTAPVNLLLLGINHRTAELRVREQLWFSDAELRAALPALKEQFFAECFMLSTCNRTELYGILDSRKYPFLNNTTGEDITQALISFKSAKTVRREHLYLFSGSRAAAHLFKVAGGIDSMVIGDIQILNQVKAHFGIAQEAGAAGTLLNRLVQTAFHVGKRARTETAICEGAVSVSYAAVELANKIFSNLAEKTVLLIGAGETGELTAKNLAARGVSALLIANRTRAKAEELAAEIRGSVAEFDGLEENLPDVDIVISSIHIPNYVLTADHVRHAMKLRSHRALLIMDLGVPRNIDPKANKLDNVFVHDMDSLALIVSQNLQRRRLEIPAVKAIILEELISVARWFNSLSATLTIADLREHFEALRVEEVKKHINRFTKEDRDLVELVTKRIVNKLLHMPTVQLRSAGEYTAEERHSRIHLLRGLFGLRAKPGYRAEANGENGT